MRKPRRKSSELCATCGHARNEHNFTPPPLLPFDFKGVCVGTFRPHGRVTPKTVRLSRVPTLYEQVKDKIFISKHARTKHRFDGSFAVPAFVVVCKCSAFVPKEVKP